MAKSEKTDSGGHETGTVGSNEHTGPRAGSQRPEGVSEGDQASSPRGDVRLDAQPVKELRSRYSEDLTGARSPDHVPKEYLRERQRLDGPWQQPSFDDGATRQVEVPSSALYLAEAKAWNVAEVKNLTSTPNNEFTALLAATRAMGREYADQLRCSLPELKDVPLERMSVAVTWRRDSPTSDWRTSRVVLEGGGAEVELRPEPAQALDAQRTDESTEASSTYAERVLGGERTKSVLEQARLAGATRAEEVAILRAAGVPRDLALVNDDTVRSTLAELYTSTSGDAGTGTTMDAVKEEARTLEPVRNSYHITKLHLSDKRLEKVLSSGSLQAEEYAAVSAFRREHLQPILESQDLLLRLSRAQGLKGHKDTIEDLLARLRVD